jgi:hypothetical protein
MAIEPSISPQPPVRPVNDTDRGRPDAQHKRDSKKRQQNPHAAAHPTPNERGEITGKLIDIVA